MSHGADRAVRRNIENSTPLGFTNVKAIDLLDKSKCWSEYFRERRAVRELGETAGGGSWRTGPSRARLCARQYR